MARPKHLLAVTALVALLLVGPWATTGVVGEAVKTDGGERELSANGPAPDDESPVAVRIDCNRSRVEFAAPEEYQYDATVVVANVTATNNDVTRSTVGSLAGNETIDFAAEGIVFAFAQDSSDRERIVAANVTNCSANATAGRTSARPEEAELAVRVDCAENAVRFVAPEGVEYTAKVSVTGVSPTRSSSRSVTRTLEGNATVSVDEEGLVAAFASTGELGGDRTVSVIRNCSPYGRERASENATTDAE